MNKKNLRELLGIHTNSPLYPGQACGLCDQSKQDPSNFAEIFSFWSVGILCFILSTDMTEEPTQ